MGPTKLDSTFLGLSHLLWIFWDEPSCWMLFWFSSGTTIHEQACSYASCMSSWVAQLNERFCSNLLVLLWDLITGDVDWVHFHWYKRRMKLNERGLFCPIFKRSCLDVVFKICSKNTNKKANTYKVFSKKSICMMNLRHGFQDLFLKNIQPNNKISPLLSRENHFIKTKA